MKQTAIEWLAEQIQNQINYFCPGGILDDNMIEQAKEMEKQQIIEAFDKGLFTENVYYGYDDKKAEQYYNETFKSE